MLRIFFAIASLISAAPVYAAETAPPLKSAERIIWAIKCAGPMPALMAASLAIILALVIISIIFYKKGGGGNE